MSLLNDYKNMLHDLKDKKRTFELKNEMQSKYKKLFELSEKLFDKIYDEDSNKNDLLIIEKMLKMKMEKDAGNITKLNADKAIGETLCNVYVKPMLKDKVKDKNK